MRVLVDTHTFLWAVLEDHKLSENARRTWLDEANELLISPASLWEIAIKVGLGKLEVDEPLDGFFDRELAINDLTVLAIAPRHAAAISLLPHHHRDPFDRMLAVQAAVEGVPIVSADALLDAYGVRRLW